MSDPVTLSRDSNQALGLGQYARDFLAGKLGPGPGQAVLERTRLFHTDSVLCGVSALALGTNAPTVLRNEALGYPDYSGAPVFGSSTRVRPEKAALANCAAVREWDSNGTNFGYRPQLGHTAGEFGHNDFYPVVVAACQQRGLDGRQALLGMVLLDEVRGRLAEVFSLKTYKIDHVVHGAIASAVVYGALLGATPEEIESAVGMFVAHYVPWRAIRAGKQLSDSKGASAAISTEAALQCVHRSMAGFRGPRDIFRNPEALFRFFEPTTDGEARWQETGDSPFDLVLSHSGDDFAVMGMHFKLGLYEHQSAGALQAVVDALVANPHLLSDPAGGGIQSIEITAYEPAYGIIGNPAKMDPKTRQSADHSMAYIVATLVRKALEAGRVPAGGGSNGEGWKALMLSPWDYKEDETAVFHPLTRAIMKKVTFRHGGPEYDAKYPEGIPTSVVVTGSDGGRFDSGLVMFPAGHAGNTSADLEDILRHKFEMLGTVAYPDPGQRHEAVGKLEAVGSATPAELADLYSTPFVCVPGYE
jgi:2-methylcitrate dehydratase